MRIPLKFCPALLFLLMTLKNTLNIFVHGWTTDDNSDFQFILWDLHSCTHVSTFLFRMLPCKDCPSSVVYHKHATVLELDSQLTNYGCFPLELGSAAAKSKYVLKALIPWNCTIDYNYCLYN